MVPGPRLPTNRTTSLPFLRVAPTTCHLLPLSIFSSTSFPVWIPDVPVTPVCIRVECLLYFCFKFFHQYIYVPPSHMSVPLSPTRPNNSHRIKPPTNHRNTQSIIRKDISLIDRFGMFLQFHNTRFLVMIRLRRVTSLYLISLNGPRFYK